MEQIRCTRAGARAGFDHLFYVTVVRNWVSSLGKLAIYSSFTMYIYSGPRRGSATYLLYSITAATQTTVL
jgi:hypothetical protein